MSAIDASMILIDAFRVLHQIVASHTEDSRGVIYGGNIVIAKGTRLAYKYQTRVELGSLAWARTSSNARAGKAYWREGSVQLASSLR